MDGIYYFPNSVYNNHVSSKYYLKKKIIHMSLIRIKLKNTIKVNL